MVECRQKRSGFAWLEILLAISLLSLGMLLFPTAFGAVLRHADPRRWGQGVWIGLNCGLVLVLVAYRFRWELSGVRRRLFSPQRHPLGVLGDDRQPGGSEQDDEARALRDAEWRERAKKRLPFT